jgi:predicted RNA methylase
LGVNGSIGLSCLDKVLVALQVNGREFIDFGTGDGRVLVASLLIGATSAYGYELAANKAHQYVLSAAISKFKWCRASHTRLCLVIGAMHDGRDKARPSCTE